MSCNYPGLGLLEIEEEDYLLSLRDIAKEISIRHCEERERRSRPQLVIARYVRSNPESKLDPAIKSRDDKGQIRGMTTFCHSGNFVQGCAKLSGIQESVMDEGNGDFWIPRSSRGMTRTGLLRTYLAMTRDSG